MPNILAKIKSNELSSLLLSDLSREHADNPNNIIGKHLLDNKAVNTPTFLHPILLNIQFAALKKLLLIYMNTRPALIVKPR